MRSTCDRDGNLPRVRQVVDELVQIGHGVHLGKAHMQVRPGDWRMVAVFALEGPE